MKIARLILSVAVLAIGYSGLGAGELYQLDPHAEPRWASPENPGGQKGGGALTQDGRKGRPSVPLKAGAAL
ncbi:MAG TPA: hypothetical protein VGM73_17560, partial [Candidatus Didemnitutus sp.]